HFFGGDPRLRSMVVGLPDDEPLLGLPRGGHDRTKLYAAYAAAVAHEGSPTVILAKTVKGSGLGPEVESRNAAHQIKKIARPGLLALRDRLALGDQVSDEAIDAGMPPYVRLPEGSPEEEYLLGRRHCLGGAVPRR